MFGPGGATARSQGSASHRPKTLLWLWPVYDDLPPRCGSRRVTQCPIAARSELADANDEQSTYRRYTAHRLRALPGLWQMYRRPRVQVQGHHPYRSGRATGYRCQSLWRLRHLRPELPVRCHSPTAVKKRDPSLTSSRWAPDHFAPRFTYPERQRQ